MARAEHVNLQLRTWTQRNLQPNSQPPKCMGLKTVSAANEVLAYTQLQQQIHDALRAQHPEWVQPDGDSPTCDAYEWRFAELLRIRARDSATKMRQDSPILRRVCRERVSSRAGTSPLKRHSQNETLTTNSRDCHMTPATGNPQCLMFTRLRGLAAEGVFVSTAKNKSE